MKNPIKLLFSLSFLIVQQYVFSAFAFAQDSKEVINTYRIGEETSINILAKDTEVYLISDTGKNVTVIAEIVSKAKTDEKKRAFLEGFDNNVSDKIKLSEDELLINTDLEFPIEKVTQFKLFGTINYYNIDGYSLKYTIKIPSNKTVKISTSYENLFLSGDFKEVFIDINSGDLIADNIETLNLQAKYGDVRIKSIENASINLYEVNLEAKKIEKLKLNTKYSDLLIEELNFSEIESYEDEFSITEARQMSGLAKYSTLSFKKEIRNLDLELIYETKINAGLIHFARLRESKYSKIVVDEINEIFLDNSYEDKLKVEKLNSIIVNGKYFEASIYSLNNSFKANLYEGDIKISEASKTTKFIQLDGKYNTININLNKVPFSLNADINYGYVNLPSIEVEKKLYIKENSKLKMEVNTLDYKKGLTLMFNGHETKVKLF